MTPSQIKFGEEPVSLNDKKTLDGVYRKGQIDGGKNEYHSQVPGGGENMEVTLSNIPPWLVGYLYSLPSS